MSARIWVQQIMSGDGSKLMFEKDDIIVIVGPNNSGKSTLLREMANVSKEIRWTENAKIVKGLSLAKEGSQEDLVETLKSRSYRINKNGSNDIYYGYKFTIPFSNATIRWKEMNSLGLESLGDFFFSSITADGRLGIADSVQSIDVLRDIPTHPLHFLYQSDQDEFFFSQLFETAFSSELIVNKGAGKSIYLHVGSRPKIKRGEDRVSRSYLEKLQELPTIQEQGDGMRSYVGLMLSLYFGNATVFLIDEPEVFLHPPQARLLGKMIANDLSTDNQLFISTHSEDFLKGLLDSKSKRVKIIRVDRNGHVNTLKELTKTDIDKTWNDPLLRYSNTLSGLFHTRVILCEADSDCKFYSAVLDELIEDDKSRDKNDRIFRSTVDPLFIHCGGKYRMPSVVKALRKINVPMTVIGDFDVLSDENPLRKIFEELGGSWEVIKSDWALLKNQIEGTKADLRSEEVKAEITDILKRVTSTVFPQKEVSNIKEVLKKASPWSQAKAAGKSVIPNGDATKAYQRLIKNLIAVGLHIVEVGILESFAKSVSGHGPEWVNEVLTKDLRKDPELKEAREFVKGFIK